MTPAPRHLSVPSFQPVHAKILPNASGDHYICTVSNHYIVSAASTTTDGTNNSTTPTATSSPPPTKLCFISCRRRLLCRTIVQCHRFLTLDAYADAHTAEQIFSVLPCVSVFIASVGRLSCLL
uniref:Uncharacterized protein n=1 Tax=Nelumbo nucifera TaxID=4432 RepID=A0A822Y0I6_NELNU|nr:TPA_asm: hypothetical protein HUJ06_028892 [Nelumbo nucifera]